MKGRQHAACACGPPSIDGDDVAVGSGLMGRWGKTVVESNQGPVVGRDEIKELQAKIKSAMVNKERSAQIAEVQYRKQMDLEKQT